MSLIYKFTNFKIYALFVDLNFYFKNFLNLNVEKKIKIFLDFFLPSKIRKKNNSDQFIDTNNFKNNKDLTT